MPRRGPRYSREEAEQAIAASICYAEALRRLGMRSAGHNPRTLKKYAEEIWRIPTDHFDPSKARNLALAKGRATRTRPLSSLLTRGSRVNRGQLKRSLYREGLKVPVCEMCGQGEIWQGERISLILDHINGIADDNRLENLRIVCPNCAATLDTHCGRQNRLEREPRRCVHCGKEFPPAYYRQRYCSRHCGMRAKGDGGPRPETRKVDRPPYTHLMREVAAIGYSATGRRYGVSNTAIKKWIRQYEKEQAAEQPPEDVAA